MKVLLVTPSLGFGGAEQQLALLAARLRRDHEVRVRCLFEAGPLAGPLRDAGVVVEVGRLSSLPWRAFRGLRERLLGGAARRRAGGTRPPAKAEATSVSAPPEAARAVGIGRALRRVSDSAAETLLAVTAAGAFFSCRRLQPDVVHAYQHHGRWALAGSRRAGRPVTCYTEVSLVGDLLSRQQLRRLARCLRSTDRVIAMSAAIRGHLVAAGVEPERIDVVPTMVDMVERTERVDAGRGRDGKLRFGVVGRLVEGKGHAVLLDAFARLGKAGTGTGTGAGIEVGAGAEAGVGLVIAGDGPLRATLAAHADALGLGGRVRFLGEFSDLGPIMAELDVFVLPSFSEGMPVSILEAMAHGKPVIASRVGGIPEEVEDEVTGLLVPPGDTEALALAMRRLLLEPETRVRMGEAGRRRVRDEFDAERLTARVVELYHRKGPRAWRG